MPIEPGSRLGPYQILAPIGAGGMGEVYRARDTRLDRTVAIKVLPSHLSASAESRQRFDREARTISSISHPHICALFDVGHEETAQGTVDFLVMEYLEGETLADRLSRGPLSTPQVLRHGIEIAQALHAAHHHGVVHRDLKPGNVVLTRSGAKLLDFGLAKLQAPGDVDLTEFSALPTAAKPLTEEGRILGTVLYMAPEQLEGKNADTRADTFALGAILYEMATGRRAFSGQSRASLIAAILSSEPPPVSSLQPMSPRALDRVVRTCLAKDPDERWQSAHDVSTELSFIAEALSQETTAPGSTPRRRLRDRVVWAVAGAVLGSLIGGAALWNRTPSSPPAWFPKRFSLELPAAAPLADTLGSGEAALALSPDGTAVVYVAAVGGRTQLYMRLMDRLEASPIPGTEGGYTPFFSPDGRWLGFFADGKLKKVSVAGGEPLTLCEAATPRGASWGEGGTILFASGHAGGLSFVPAEGGQPRTVTTPDAGRGDTSHRWPHFLPGGRAALFTTVTASFREDENGIAVLVLATGVQRTLLKGGSYPRYSATGHLLYARKGSLIAAPIDLGRLELAGPGTSVLDDVRSGGAPGMAFFDVSLHGPLVYVPGYPRPANRDLLRVDRQGKARPLTATRRPFSSLAVSPDGTQLAVIVEGETLDVFVYEIARDTWTRLTFEADNEELSWSADGRRVAFNSNRRGPRNLFWLPADGSGVPEVLAEGKNWMFRPSFSSDGRWCLYSENDPATGFDIWLMSLADRTRQPLLTTPHQEADPQFSPDGRWFAYGSNESGRYEIYVRRFPGPGGKWPVSTARGRQPLWSRTGREIFYRNADTVMTAPVQAGNDFSAGRPQALFEIPGMLDWWPFADGQEFAVIKSSPKEAGPLRIVVIPDSADELQARLRAERDE